MVSAVSGKQGAPKAPWYAVLANSWVAAVTFFKEVWAELQKARWPSREELGRFTTVVIAAVVVVAVYMYSADKFFAWLSRVVGIFPR